MPCGYDLISSNVALCGTTKAVKGLEPKIWLAPREYFVTQLASGTNTITDSNFGMYDNFVELTGVKDVFNTGSEGVPSDFIATGYKHSLTIVANLTSSELDKFDNVVALVERKGDKTYPFDVYGLKNGLWKTSDSRKHNDNNNLRTIELASRDGMEEDFASVNVVLPYATALQYVNVNEVINTLYIPDGRTTAQKVYIEVDSSKTATALMPDGITYSTSSGIINEDYTGIGGRCVITYPKSSSKLRFSDESLTKICKFYGDLTLGFNGNFYAEYVDLYSFIGNNILYIYLSSSEIYNLIANNAVSIDINSNNNLNNKTLSFNNALSLYVSNCGISGLICNKGIIIDASNNNLKDGSLNELMQGLVLYGNIDGTLDISGGTSESFDNWSTDTLYYYNQLVSRGWTITYNS